MAVHFVMFRRRIVLPRRSAYAWNSITNWSRLLRRLKLTGIGVTSAQLFLVLHATILEPGLHLGFAQAERRRQLDAFGRRQIAAASE